ncbi:ABC transporter substrate-binding protein [Shimia sediminis]|uniref:ABC transporter substrate-binding protein n=1 Tax=Shimia sediminis TaxID=2497945 RepID=UPI001F2E95D9|nr:ABC transporter substrate-binding protein [Shimia sediminis]
MIPYILSYANGGLNNHVLLPVFLLRVFRHKSVFIRPDRGIERPEDLKGKTIASPGFSSSSLTWIRGFMQDEYGVSPRDVKWVISSKDTGEQGHRRRLGIRKPDPGRAGHHRRPRGVG